jgi:leader peptidase (prepilin peptidase)/N-methyltransferase
MVALTFCLFLAGLIVATFIDFEHYIIPDEITIGGMVVGFFASFFLPELHAQDSAIAGMLRSLLGICAGAGLIYFILRLGKLLFGRQKISVPAAGKIIFTETSVHLPDQEIPYEEIFYRRSDTIKLQATIVELCDRSYKNVPVRLSLMSKVLRIGDEELNPEQVLYMEIAATEIVLPREAMGLGDVKFMGAIGAFLGWQAVFFTVAVSSAIGAVVGLTLIALGKRERSKYLPYGPYLATAAAIWIFFGPGLWHMVFGW